MPLGKSVEMQKPIQIDKASIQKIDRAYIAEVKAPKRGTMYQQAMDFAISNGSEPTVEYVEGLLNSAQGRSLVAILRKIAAKQPSYGDWIFHCWLWLKSEVPSSTDEKHPSHTLELDFDGKAKIITGNYAPEGTAPLVMWIENGNEVTTTPAKRLSRKENT